MRFGRDRKYSKQEDGSYIPEDEPDSAAGVLRCSTQSIRYDIQHWEVVHTTAGHEPSDDRELFTFQRDDPGSTYLRCLLETEGRRFHVITDSGITPFNLPIELKLFPLSTTEVEIEGRLTHHPRWESSYDGEVYDERIFATLGMPADRFAWFLDRLRLPGVRVVIILDMRVYKEQIALSFDEPWMNQDFAVEHKGTSHITQYQLHVIEGPGIPEDDAPAEDRFQVDEPATVKRLSDKPMQATVGGVSTAQRSILVVAALLLLLFAFSGATTYGSDQHLATFNFLAAVACLYLALRRPRWAKRSASRNSLT